MRQMAAQTPVAPVTGAWIETSPPGGAGGNRTSRPSRARGLKPYLPEPVTITNPSRPSRARGLKQRDVLLEVDDLPVAPVTGAWIETARSCTERSSSSCRARHGRVD